MDTKLRNIFLAQQGLYLVNPRQMDYVTRYQSNTEEVMVGSCDAMKTKLEEMDD